MTRRRPAALVTLACAGAALLAVGCGSTTTSTAASTSTSLPLPTLVTPFTPAPTQAKPSNPSSTPAPTTQLTLAGSITGSMQNPVTTCGAGTGDASGIGVTGTVNGGSYRLFMPQGSSGPLDVEFYSGTTEIFAGDGTGVSGYDIQHGATIDSDLNATAVGGPSSSHIHISGKIVCP